MLSENSSRNRVIIDAHAHVWDVEHRLDITAVRDSPYFKDKIPDLHTLEKTAIQSRVSSICLVQSAPIIGETQWLLDISAENPFVAGVVGWIDLEHSVEEQLHSLRNTKKLVAIRAQLPRFRDDYFSSQQVVASLHDVGDLGLAVSLLSNELHHDYCIDVLSDLPFVNVVLNHCGWPRLDGQDQSLWRCAIERYSRRPNTFIQISGLATRSRGKISEMNLVPAVGHVLDCFGTKRIIFGSDWPMQCVRGLGYSEWPPIVRRALIEVGVDESELDLFFARNVDQAYGLGIFI